MFQKNKKREVLYILYIIKNNARYSDIYIYSYIPTILTTVNILTALL